jgi:hypothetical protein
MRSVALFVGLVLVLSATAQEKKENPATRYDVVGDAETYPQGSPKETLTSIAKAIERERIDYLLAHLADPQYVDAKVKDLGKFRDLVDAVKAHFTEDAKRQREFLRLLKDGIIEAGGSEAKVTLKEVAGRQITLKQNGKRWFLDNPDAPKKN